MTKCTNAGEAMAQRQKVSIKSGGAVILRVLAGRACRKDVEEPSQMEAIALGGTAV